MGNEEKSPAETAKQHLRVSRAMWDIVDKWFDPVKVLTREGCELILSYSIKAAHPVLPHVLHFLAMMCALAKGAKSQWFPNAPSPIFIFAINVNYTQTKESSLTGNGDAFGDLLDQATRDDVSHKMTDAQAASSSRRTTVGTSAPAAGIDADVTPLAKVVSCVIHSATLTEFFHRVSGDHPQVAIADTIGCEELRGRHKFGNLGNFDEAYDILNALSMLDDGKTNNKGKSTVNSYQSTFNKFAQYGQASRSTKTAGSYGKVDTPTTSTGLSGNMHFSTYVPMERGESGAHHVAAKERLLISTERPIQPHAPLPEDYPMPGGHSASKWVPLVKDVAEMLQIVGRAAGPEEAAKVWPRMRCLDNQPGLETIDGKTYIPDASGFKVKLPDGVSTQVRFRRDPQAPTGFRAQWLVSNRSFPMPLEHSLETCVPRVCEYFNTPHTPLNPTEDALALHQSYQAGYNVKGYLQRESGDVHGGAAQGAAPWHLGMLASALCLFDVFRGDYDYSEAYSSRTIEVEEDHVERAAALVKVIYLLKEAAVNTGDEDGPSNQDWSGHPRVRGLVLSGSFPKNRSVRILHSACILYVIRSGFIETLQDPCGTLVLTLQ